MRDATRLLIGDQSAAMSSPNAGTAQKRLDVLVFLLVPVKSKMHNLAKVGVERSNRFTRSSFLDIEKPRFAAAFVFSGGLKWQGAKAVEMSSVTARPPNCGFGATASGRQDTLGKISPPLPVNCATPGQAENGRIMRRLTASKASGCIGNSCLGAGFEKVFWQPCCFC